jgi:hypothetical protein
MKVSKTLINGLTAGIDVLPVRVPTAEQGPPLASKKEEGQGVPSVEQAHFFVLSVSDDLAQGAPGRLLFYDSANATPVTLAAPLVGPTCVARDARSGDLFVTSAEGWSAVSINNSGVITGTHAVTWNATGGNPGGHISRTDPQSGSTFYFVAPPSYLGDMSAACGGALTYDERRTAGTTFVGGDVHLVGGASPLTLVFDSAAMPTTAWTPFTIPLSTGQWHVGTYTGALATEQQIRAVLAALTALRIRGEYVGSTTNETGYLDNVSLNAPDPEPAPEAASVALMGTGLAGCAFVARRRRREAKRRRRSRDCRHAYVEPAGLSL